MRTHIPLVVLVAYVYITCAAFLLAQTDAIPKTPAQAKPLPNNASEMLALLVKSNGLDISGTRAWHIKLSYDHFDDDGDNDSSGTYEEWWAGPREFKREYASENFHRTEVANTEGLFVTGDQQWPGRIEWQVREEVVEPLYRSAVPLSTTKPDNFSWTVGSVTLPCVVVRGGRIISDNGLPKFCFDPNSEILRYTRGRGWDETTYNKISPFQDRYVGREVGVTQGGKKYLQIHVKELDTIAQVQDAEFLRTPGAVGPIGDGIEVPSSVMGEYMIPRFPAPFPHFGGKRGAVKLEIQIGRDGHVRAAKVISGPEGVEKSAIAAAKQMEFRPFLVLGAPVAVRTTWGFSIAP